VTFNHVVLGILTNRLSTGWSPANDALCRFCPNLYGLEPEPG
jgi:hypothetical protein